MIESKEITVLVQGPILEFTKYSLESIRKYLPDSTIVLSTWEGSDTSNLIYDKLVLSKDPGVLYSNSKGKLTKTSAFNLNRQLVSTTNGLREISTKYALKLRSDLVLDSLDFLSYFDKFNKRTTNYRLFSHKVIISSIFTRYTYTNSGDKGKIPFHYSDFFFFGLTEDLKNYFYNTPLIDKEFTSYFSDKDIMPTYNMNYRFTPEQYFAIECIKRNNSSALLPKDAADITLKIFKESELYLMNNFIVLDYKQSGIRSLKYKFTKNEEFLGSQYNELYNFYRFENKYKRLYDKSYQITSKAKKFSNKREEIAYYNLQKKIYNVFIRNNMPLHKKLSQFIFDLPFSFITYLLKKYMR